MNEQSDRPIHLAGVNLRKHGHICAFFHNQDQEDKVIVPFLKEGIERGERAFCIAGPEIRTHLLRKLRLAGSNVETVEKRGQLKIEPWESAIVRHGYFNQDAMVAGIERILSQGRKEGYELTRVVGRMDWVLEYNVGIYDLVKYESKLNHMLQNFDDPVVCAYELSAFHAGVLVDILRTHPVAIIGDVAAENPFFDPAEVILQEISRHNT